MVIVLTEGEMDMDPRNAWKYRMYNKHTFNKHDNVTTVIYQYVINK